MAFTSPHTCIANFGQFLDQTGTPDSQNSGDSNFSKTQIQPKDLVSSESVDSVGNQQLSSADHLACPLPQSSDHNSGLDVKLRTASRKRKKTASKKPAVPRALLHARESHNQVEKQYRIRLKTLFEKLLAVLPLSQLQGINSYESSGCRFSRGEVLDAARQRILWLEKENSRLTFERGQLLTNLPTARNYTRSEEGK